MTKQKMTEYLLEVLKMKRDEMLKANAEYEKASHMERVGLAIRTSRVEDAFYAHWTICNDLGIIRPGDINY